MDKRGFTGAVLVLILSPADVFCCGNVPNFGAKCSDTLANFVVLSSFASLVWAVVVIFGAMGRFWRFRGATCEPSEERRGGCAFWNRAKIAPFLRANSPRVSEHFPKFVWTLSGIFGNLRGLFSNLSGIFENSRSYCRLRRGIAVFFRVAAQISAIRPFYRCGLDSVYNLPRTMALSPDESSRWEQKTIIHLPHR